MFIDDFYLWIPNVFSPNGDGLNDTFYPIYDGLENMTFQIWDRWGRLVGEFYDFEQWDGTKEGQAMPEGVYVYIVNANKPDGYAIERVGTVTLLR